MIYFTEANKPGNIYYGTRRDFEWSSENGYAPQILSDGVAKAMLGTVLFEDEHGEELWELRTCEDWATPAE